MRFVQCGCVPTSAQMHTEVNNAIGLLVFCIVQWVMPYRLMTSGLGTNHM